MASDENPIAREGPPESQRPVEPIRDDSQKTYEGALQATLAVTPLNEDLALALLKRYDLPPEVLERLSKNGAAMTSRKVKLALVEHPRTPRHVSMPMVRHLFTFDLMQIALTPITPADLKLAAEEALIHRLEAVSPGEKLSLARQASARVAGQLLLEAEPRIIQAVLDNARLTEATVFKALMRPDATATFVQAVCRHPKWSLRREVRIALLRNENTPLARALEFARSLPAALVREILQPSRLPVNIKAQLLQEIERHQGCATAARSAQS
jgi:hypothetical protein